MTIDTPDIKKFQLAQKLYIPTDIRGIQLSPS